MKNVHLFENHDEALSIWRKQGAKNIDLVHIDAHIDCKLHDAQPLDKILDESKSVSELKKNLEYFIAYRRFQKDLEKQTNLGNFIYPAMKEDIVKNFYWIVPGRLAEFKRSGRRLKDTLSQKLKINTTIKNLLPALRKGTLKIEFLGKNIFIMPLEKLPLFKKQVLLDIDTDFLITEGINYNETTEKIGKRRPWINPNQLIDIINRKIENPRLTTISYSVEEGYTPIKYKQLADEIAYLLSPEKFSEIYAKNLEAAGFFQLFKETGKKEYYDRAVKINPTYRSAYNNYGFIYYSNAQFSKAKSEFEKTYLVDPKNPACRYGLGQIALQNEKFDQAKNHFQVALNQKENVFFRKEITGCYLGLGMAEFGLKKFKKAKHYLLKYRKMKPLNDQANHLLGLIYEKEKNFKKASEYYKNAIILGAPKKEPIKRLIKIASNLEKNDAIYEFAFQKFKDF